jgi:hypothetical protein
MSTVGHADHDKLDYKKWCKQTVEITGGVVMKQALQSSNQLRRDYCLQITLEKDQIKTHVLSLLTDLNGLLGGSETTRKMQNAQELLFQTSSELDTMSLTTSPKHYFTMGDVFMLSVEEVQACDRYAKSVFAGATCESTLIEFIRIYQFAHSTYAQPHAVRTYGELVSLGKAWDRFSAESKAQTELELLINGAVFNASNDDVFFKAPPSWQVVALHPNLVIENMPDAVDGDEVKESILLEVIGIDFWQQDKLWLPTGASIVTLNIDRNSSSDWGYGLGLTFDNKYLLGFAHHEDDKNGVFISFDILKAFEDKRDKLVSFKDEITF